MSVGNTPFVQELWKNWERCKDEKTGNALIEHYMYLVNYHVDRVASNIPSTFDRNDLMSLGLMGLFDSLHKFDLSRNLKFDTYATIRIHGAIMDGLRKEDWLPRTLRDKSKKIEKMDRELEQKLSRKPSSKEIAVALGWPLEEVEDIIADTLYANLLSTDANVMHDESNETNEIVFTTKDEDTPTPMDLILETEVKDQLIIALKKLNQNEQMVISLHYMEELTLTEIGKVMNVTTSRISQIHKKAIIKLKDILIKITK